MSDQNSDPSLERLEARLQAARDHRDRANGKRPEQDEGGNTKSGLGFAFRLGVELVGALAVGVGIGFLLDNWLETKPLFLVIFFFLGAAAGFLNVYRVAKGYGSAVGFSKPNGTDSSDRDG